jgi:hypothetical protein
MSKVYLVLLCMYIFYLHYFVGFCGVLFIHDLLCLVCFLLHWILFSDNLIKWTVLFYFILFLLLSLLYIVLLLLLVFSVLGWWWLMCEQLLCLIFPHWWLTKVGWLNHRIEICLDGNWSIYLPSPLHLFGCIYVVLFMDFVCIHSR